MKSIRILSVVFALCLVLSVMPTTFAFAQESDVVITLSSENVNGSYVHLAKIDGQDVKEYDYTWNIDPFSVHDEVKNSPAEYYTGTKPSGDEAVYIAHDVYYYPLLEQDKFQLVNYDGENEWVYFYQSQEYKDYIFSTLPSLKTGFPQHMMHSAKEAYENAVLHITKPGTYVLKGSWHGQINVNLGEDSFDDETQKVTLILDGVDIECSVSSAIVFEEVYECDNTWEEKEKYSYMVDTSDAGANIVIADDSENNVSGTNVFRILKTQYKDDDSTDTYPAQKKRLKTDGALYSYRSLNISGQEKGNGVLNVTSGFEGLNSELHLSINSGNVNIFSQDDGINVNEDGVSVLTVNGGNLHICAGLGAEGDGVDSNGFLVINGGNVISSANPAADSGLDSDFGSYVFGGNVISLGSTMDWAKSDESAEKTQAILNMRFSSSQNSDEAIIITDLNDKVVFAYDPDKDEVLGSNLRSYSGAVLSADTLKVGETYRIYIGGEIKGSETNGIYDTSTVSSFSGATLQCYSGNSVGGMGGGFMPDRNFENMPARPEGQGNMRPDKMPTDDIQIPFDKDFEGKGNAQNVTNIATCTFNSEFELTQTVNAFSSVTDFKHSLVEENGVYTCTFCNKSFEDELGTKQVVTFDDFKTSPIMYVLVFIAGAVFASIIFTVVLIIKNRKGGV